MKVNIHMDMVDRVCGYMFDAKFPFEYDDEDALRRGVEILNGGDPGDDAITERGWAMYRKLLREANIYMIQSLPANSREGAEEIINHMLEYDYDEEYLGECADDDLPQVIANIKHYRGILKHAKYNSTEYREYTDKLAELYSQLLKYDYENCEDILFDCEEAFVVEWEEEKEKKGEAKFTNLEEVKRLTVEMIRYFPIESMDRFGTVSHPVATHVVMPNPENPVWGNRATRHEVREWCGKNTLVYALDNPHEREAWFKLVEKKIYAASTIEDIYKNVIRGNWIDSWKQFVKAKLSFADREKVSKAFADHMEWVNQERDRLFPVNR